MQQKFNISNILHSDILYFRYNNVRFYCTFTRIHYVLGHSRLLLVLLHDPRSIGWNRFVVCVEEVSVCVKKSVSSPG